MPELFQATRRAAPARKRGRQAVDVFDRIAKPRVVGAQRKVQLENDHFVEHAEFGVQRRRARRVVEASERVDAKHVGACAGLVASEDERF